MALKVFGNDTGSSIYTYVTWEPEPTRRGTWSILSSCLITLILCIWSAVHINVPETHQAHRFGLTLSAWRKIGWSVLGWLAPEVVAFIAWHQLRKATVLRNEYNRHIASHQKSWPWWRRHLPPTIINGIGVNDDKDYNLSSGAQSQILPWTLRHGFLGAMGGFAVEYPDQGSPSEGRFLTYQGVLFLAKHSPEILPKLSVAEIKDQSKANAMTKAPACIQTAWFLIQMTHRIFKGLPVSLLELNTSGHALCALLIWAMWWNKPFDLPKPFVIQVSGSDCASQKMLHFMNIVRKGLRGSRVEVLDPEGLEVNHKVPNPYNFTDRIFHIRTRSTETEPQCRQYTHEMGITASIDDRLEGTRFYQPDHYFPGNVFRMKHSERVKLTPVDATEWSLVSEIYAASCPLGKRTILQAMVQKEVFIESRIRNTRGLRVRGSRSFLAVLAAASLIYGGLHALAWTAAFPSKVEKLLWQISAVAVMLCLSGVILIVFGIRLSFRALCSLRRFGENAWYRGDLTGKSILIDEIGPNAFVSSLLLAAVPTIAGTVMFAFGRIYFIVEGFLQLLHLPQAAYDVPLWSQYIPHIA